jgi:uncharacterized protein (DUF952 family)
LIPSGRDDAPPVSRSLFHIVAADDWAAAQLQGEYRASSLADEGFIHCSYDEQVAATLRRHYPELDGLIVLELDTDRIGVPVRVEDSYSSGAAFPHIYGPLPIAAAVAVHPTTRWINGPGDRAAAASPDQ